MQSCRVDNFESDLFVILCNNIMTAVPSSFASGGVGRKGERTWTPARGRRTSRWPTPPINLIHLIYLVYLYMWYILIHLIYMVYLATTSNLTLVRLRKKSTRSSSRSAPREVDQAKIVYSCASASANCIS